MNVHSPSKDVKLRSTDEVMGNAQLGATTVRTKVLSAEKTTC